MRSDIVPGGIFPDYELPDHTDKLCKLSELQGDDPLILTLARGHYCPKEHQQHLELAAFYPKIAVAYTQIATIATDDHHTLQEFRASVGAEWTRAPWPAPMTRYAWQPSAGATSTCGDRIAAFRSARTVRRRWRWRISRYFAPFIPRPFFIRAMRCPRRGLPKPWLGARAS